MKEKEIIKSELLDIKKIAIIIVVIGVIIGFINMFISVKNEKDWKVYRACSTYEYYGIYDTCAEKYKIESTSLFEFIRTDHIMILGAIIIAFGIIAYTFNRAYSKQEIIVTNKRVYGIGNFGKRFDFSLDNITSINTTSLKGIKFDISPKPKRFLMIKNYNEIYESISDLIRKK